MQNLENPSSETNVLNKTVITLGLVSFFADVASEMLYPLTPIFITTVLGASVSTLGLMEGLAEATAALMKTYSGAWSDSLKKRKPFILAGYFLGAISKPLIGISTQWHHILEARVLDRFGKGLRSAPRDALISDSVPQEKKGEAFGWHRAMDTAGAAVGPLLALLFLSQSSQDLRQLYFWATIPGLVSVLLILFLKEKTNIPANKNWKNPIQSWNQLSLPLKKFILSWTLFALTNSSDVFLLLQAKNHGASTTEVVLLYCAYNLMYSVTSPYLGKLSDRISRKHILFFGLIIFGAVYIGFSQANQIWQFLLLFLIYGLYMGATDGVSKALITDLSSSQFKATALGIIGTTTGFATIIASTFAGFLWDHVSPQFTFYYGALGAMITAIFIFYQPEISQKK